jgi:hypothetical protein
MLRGLTAVKRNSLIDEMEGNIMKRNALKGIVFLWFLVVAIMSPVVSFGFTAPSYNPAWMTNDGTNSITPSGYDINKVWWTQDATYYYFKMELAGSYILGDTGSPNKKPYYEILIDSKVASGSYNGGVNFTGTTNKVDYLIYTSFAGTTPTTTLNKSNDSGAFVSWTGPSIAFQVSADGKTLEWRLQRNADIPTSSQPYWFG